MKFGIIREGKNPPDKRVVFTPEALEQFRQNYPQASFKVEASPIRIFKDEEYIARGFEVSDDLQDCDILLGVKEVPIENLIPNKTYLFFSHTIKEQPYNKKLLQSCLEKNIRLIDHETLVDEKGTRLIGFGRYAGIVGAYNGFITYGVKHQLYSMPKAEHLYSQKDLIEELKKLNLPPIKVVLTGFGKVGYGAKEMLDGMNMKQVSKEDFLNNEYEEPIYTHIDLADYYRRKDGKPSDNNDFIAHPDAYESDFEKFTKVADIFIAGHFYKTGSPYILTQEMLKKEDNNISVIADISCDIDGPIASTLQPSTIADPIYGYSPKEHKVIKVTADNSSIAVMAVDNLPCELPRDASQGFAEMFLKEVIPAFFDGDKSGILQRGTICENGQLTPQFEYLTDYVTQ